MDECIQNLGPGASTYDRYFCYYDVAAEHDLWNESDLELQKLPKEEGWPLLIRGHIEAWRTDIPESERYKRRRKAEGFYLEGAERLQELGETDGVVLANCNIYGITSSNSRRQEAARAAVKRAMEAVDGFQAGLPRARALALKARSLFELEGDCGQSYQLLKTAQPTIFSVGNDYRLQREVLNLLGNLSLALGRFGEAQRTYRQQEALILANNPADKLALATARYNHAAAYHEDLQESPDPDRKRRDELLALARLALETAREARHDNLRMKAHHLIGILLSDRPETLSLARRHYSKSLELASQLRDTTQLYITQWALAWNHVKDGDTETARHLINEAQRMRDEGDRFLIYAGNSSLHCAWKLNGKAHAVELSRTVLEDIERLRERQSSSSSREGFFSAWTSAYYVFSGYLLRDDLAQVSHHDLETAFQVTEQMRARVLLEALITGREVPVHSDKLTSLRRQISQTNRRLAKVAQTEERQPLLADLKRLEELEAQEHYRVFEEQAQQLQAAPLKFASLGQVQESLSADEALLSFQVGLEEDADGDYGGGAWLISATRTKAHYYPLPDRRRLQQIMPVFLGLIQRRDGLETASAPILYDGLLRQALDDLPPGIHRLVIVPDGPLHHLPFGMLRPSESEPALAQRFQISIAPSATLWIDWKDKPRTAAAAPALALADPELPAPEGFDASASRQRDWTTRPLLPLPSARQEGDRLVERLGGESLLVVGKDASEHFVKTADLGRFSVLHFASHAVVDDQFPHRSAVMLAPGDEWEDGRLQVGEIADLNFEGRVIVLSACSSASGTVLSGEGVIGLARAFFRAGARTVVGSLWPLRDDDASEFFQAFYNHLGAGSSIAGALNAAQNNRIEAGEPADAWAGLIVLGDGNYIPFPGGLPQSSPLGSSLLTLIASLATAAAAAGYLVLRRRRRA